MPRRDIFIADDDRLLCELIANALRSDGHHATFAADGARALSALQRRRPDLLILDANMPVMDGFELLGALNADTSLKALPVLMLTGLRSKEDVLRAQALGVSAYVIKPFVVPVLLSRAYGLIAASYPMDAAAETVARLNDREWID